MSEKPTCPDKYRARFEEQELQRAAEEAAEQLERNTRSLREVFIEYMDRGAHVEVAVGPHRWAGYVVDVGEDFVIHEIEAGRLHVALGAITAIRLSSAVTAGDELQGGLQRSSLLSRLRDLAGASADTSVEVGGADLQPISGMLRAASGTHIEVEATNGDLWVVPVAAIGFISIER